MSRRATRYPRTVGGCDFATDTQPACRQNAGKQERQATDQLPRPVRYVVVRIVPQRVIADNVDRKMRHGCRGGSRTPCEAKERPKPDAHALRLLRGYGSILAVVRFQAPLLTTMNFAYLNRLSLRRATQRVLSVSPAME